MRPLHMIQLIVSVLLLVAAAPVMAGTSNAASKAVSSGAFYPQTAGYAVPAGQASTSTVEVRNNTIRNLTIAIDGAALGVVPAGGTMRIEEARAGGRWLTAMDGGVLMAREAVELPERGLYVWRLGGVDARDGGAALLRVRNVSGRPVRIAVSGAHRIDVAAGEAATMVGVGVGDVRVEARTPEGELVARTTVRLSAGEEKVWQVAGPEGGRAGVEVVMVTDCPRPPGSPSNGLRAVPLGPGRARSGGQTAPTRPPLCAASPASAA